MDKAFVQKYWQKLRQNSALSLNGQCVLWSGWTDKDSYGRINVKIENQWKTTGVHILAFILGNNVSLESIAGNDISHLCHNRSCVQPNHLSCESRDTNHSRTACVNTNMRSCLLHPHTLNAYVAFEIVICECCLKMVDNMHISKINNYQKTHMSLTSRWRPWHVRRGPNLTSQRLAALGPNDDVQMAASSTPGR